MGCLLCLVVFLFSVLAFWPVTQPMAQDDLCNLCTHGVSTRAKKNCFSIAFSALGRTRTCYTTNRPPIFFSHLATATSIGMHQTSSVGCAGLVAGTECVDEFWLSAWETGDFLAVNYPRVVHLRCRRSCVGPACLAFCPCPKPPSELVTLLVKLALQTSSSAIQLSSPAAAPMRLTLSI